MRRLTTALLLLSATILASEARAQTPQFDAVTDAFNVATTGLSEVLGEVILTAVSACGTNVDTACVSTAEAVEVRYSNIVIDNDASTGILICETINGVFLCNTDGNLITGVITVTEDTVSIGLKQGVNLSALDRLAIAGVRARIAEGAMSTPGVESLAVVSAVPGSAIVFPAAPLVAARSANPLTIQVTAVPEIPCNAGEPLPSVRVTEGYRTAFVDYGDALDRQFPGQPLLPRNPLGGNANTRVRLVVSGLSPDIRIHWPVSVPAQNSSAILSLISQSSDGSSATYVYGTPNQFQSDEVNELFAVRLDHDNFQFSGSDPITGLVTVQAQLLPAAEPESFQPRFSHPLGPEPGPLYFVQRRCTAPPGGTGRAEIRASIDGEDWTGNLYVNLQGSAQRNGTQTPEILEELPAGAYLAQYLSGGPGGAQFNNISPVGQQVLNPSGSIVFTFNFTGPTIATLVLTGSAPAVCPLSDVTVGTFQLANATADTQIIPVGAAIEFTFSSPLVRLPTASGVEDAVVSSSTLSVKYDFPSGLTIPPGGVLSFAETGLDLSGVAGGQSVTVMPTSIPASAVQISSNQAVVANSDLATCPQPPAFVADGITNGASFEPGMVPGSIATLFGERLTGAAGIVLASDVPLPTQLDGTSLTVNGIAVPLFAVANVGGQQQINFQLPWEVTGAETVDVVVENNGLISDSVEVGVLSLLPGLFTTDGTTGAILHGADFALVTAANPAAPGEVVVLFATGLGPVSSTPPTGSPALSEPLSITAFSPTVRVGGMLATVEFSGMAPGFVGLYQINVRLPLGIPSGNQEVTVQVADQTGKPVTIAIQ